jgi:hypothetical protein
MQPAAALKSSLLRLFRAPQIARAWHALHPKSLHAPYVQPQPAASLKVASTRHGMTQGAGQPAAWDIGYPTAANSQATPPMAIICHAPSS